MRNGPALAVVLLLLGCPDKPAAPAPEPVKPAPEPVKPAPEPEPVKPEPAPEPGGKGSVEGEVTLEGAAPEMQPLKTGADPVCAKSNLLDEAVVAKGGKLKFAVVRLAGANAPKAEPPADPVVIDQQGCQYRPRVQAAMKGQKLAIKNSDGTLHNVHTYEGSKTWFNRAQPPKSGDIVMPIDRQGVIKFKCDVHPWMTGWVVLGESPFSATTGDDGSFKIADVPAGTYSLEAWHERFGLKKAEVVVKGGEAAKVSFSFKPEDR